MRSFRVQGERREVADKVDQTTLEVAEEVEPYLR
jgi:hypothetical protein